MAKSLSIRQKLTKRLEFSANCAFPSSIANGMMTQFHIAACDWPSRELGPRLLQSQRSFYWANC